MRVKPFLILALLAALPAVAQGPEAPTPTSGKRPIHLRQHGPMKIIGIPRPNLIKSPNWAGYAVTGSQFTKALGSWIVPKVTCSSEPDSYASFFVGIDGFGDSTTEQLGSDSDCIGTTPSYRAWYQFYPNPVRLISGITVSPGDRMSATVAYSGLQFTLTMTNHTTGKHFSKTRSFSASRSSAEWIVEATTNASGQVLPLAHFTKASLGDDYTNVRDTEWAVDSSVTGPINDFGTNVWEIEMVDGSTLKAVPTPLTTDGSSFKVTWQHE